MKNCFNQKKSTAPLRGDVDIFVRSSSTKKLITQYRIRNTIVYDGLNGIIKLLAQNTGTTSTDYQIDSLRVGTGTVGPVRADTALIAEVFSMSLLDADRVETLATSQLVITKTLEMADGNGNILTEAGLFLGNGDLFARQIHPAITKTILITVTYQWQISFTS